MRELMFHDVIWIFKKRFILLIIIASDYCELIMIEDVLKRTANMLGEGPQYASGGHWRGFCFF